MKSGCKSQTAAPSDVSAVGCQRRPMSAREVRVRERGVSPASDRGDQPIVGCRELLYAFLRQVPGHRIRIDAGRLQAVEHCARLVQVVLQPHRGIAMREVAWPPSSSNSRLIRSKTSTHSSRLGSAYTELRSPIAPTVYSRRQILTPADAGFDGSSA